MRNKSTKESAATISRHDAAQMIATYLKEIASSVEPPPEDSLIYFSWAQSFGSTCGPFRGIGGQALTTFRMEAWSDQSGYAFVFCNGKVVKPWTEFSHSIRYGQRARS